MHARLLRSDRLDVSVLARGVTGMRVLVLWRDFTSCVFSHGLFDGNAHAHAVLLAAHAASMARDAKAMDPADWRVLHYESLLRDWSYRGARRLSARDGRARHRRASQATPPSPSSASSASRSAASTTSAAAASVSRETATDMYAQVVGGVVAAADAARNMSWRAPSRRKAQLAEQDSPARRAVRAVFAYFSHTWAVFDEPAQQLIPNDFRAAANATRAAAAPPPPSNGDACPPPEVEQCRHCPNTPFTGAFRPERFCDEPPAWDCCASRPSTFADA